ncbi:SAM-dependent methyltransferase [Actinosynnema sp. ALI-1.44]|nr:SAM-dependent methyltransferase [Actinosynnema sp. ALI-1.44]
MTVHENVYGRQLSEVYDQLYRGRGKDFADEAAKLARVVKERDPGADSLLDVACGTAEHLRYLRREFTDTAGLELSPQMRAIATAKLPGVPIHDGDMRDFDVGRTFDAVCCLYSTIGYMSTVEELGSSIAAMTRHVPRGGVVVVEPWWFPERFLDGYVGEAVVREGDRTVVRVSHSVRIDQVVRQEAHFVVADPMGIRHFVNVQVLTLFTEEEYRAAFDRAGCAVDFVTGDRCWSERGLFVGVRR